MLIIIIFLPALLAICLFYAYVNLIQKMIDKRQTRDQKRLCAALTFLFVAVLMFCILMILGG